MRFLVEIDHPKTGQPLSADAARAFVANGPVAGRIALRFIADVESPEQLDCLISSIPLWAISDTKVTSLIGFGDRRAHIEALLQSLPK